MPSPLHPALVHFPIVLILLGTLTAGAAAFTTRWHLRWITAALLVLGALGTLAAVSSGEEDGEAAERAPGVEVLLEEHEEWAERTQVFSLAGAALAIAVIAAAGRWPRVAQGGGIVTAAAALLASYCIYETGHRGGQLVYRHGAGVNLAPATPAGTAPERGDHAGDEDDDH